MSNPPDDEVQLDQVLESTRVPHALMEHFEVRTMPSEPAAVSIPFRDIAKDLDILLQPGAAKDDAMRKLLAARNSAATAVFDQSN